MRRRIRSKSLSNLMCTLALKSTTIAPKYTPFHPLPSPRPQAMLTPNPCPFACPPCPPRSPPPLPNRRSLHHRSTIAYPLASSRWCCLSLCNSAPPSLVPLYHPSAITCQLWPSPALCHHLYFLSLLGFPVDAVLVALLFVVLAMHHVFACRFIR